MIEWFEDLFVGMRFKSGPIQISGDEIKEFASKFDPQPFHLDDAAARKTMFRGLAASGWHSSALAMRLGIGASAVRTAPFDWAHPTFSVEAYLQ
jgi:acyl dehydratase